MKENWMDIKNKVHWELLSSIFDKLDSKQIRYILDAGSGKTSLSSLLEYFRKAKIDAVVFPGDERKSAPIKELIVSPRYNLLEYDICNAEVIQKYDLVLAHLLLGEAIKWGNSFDDLLDKLLKIKAKYFVIYDILEDPTVDYKYLEAYLDNNNFKIIAKEQKANDKPQTFTMNGQSFTGNNYICYLIEKI